ncbi:acyltransferase [Aliarcobacter cryaerophilus]|uniref:acyltransferase n=1 Tax=Aliarcobacter cryaerophilus TaxID=28198 RepID=UPI003DA2C074
MIKRIFILFLSLIESLIRNISGSIGEKLRYFYYKYRLQYCGKNVIIKENVYFDNCKSIIIDDNTMIDRNVILMAGNVNLTKYKHRKMSNVKFSENEGVLFIGKNTHIAPNCILQAHAGIKISDNCGISSGVKIYSLINLPNNSLNLEEIIEFTNRTNNAYYFASPVYIGKNVGISLNSIIMPGVSILNDSFIASNSVVMTNIKENSFAGGNPAKKIKDRFKNYGENN